MITLGRLDQISKSLLSTTTFNMAPVTTKGPTVDRYDYICIGGGSGGVASSVRGQS